MEKTEIHDVSAVCHTHSLSSDSSDDAELTQVAIPPVVFVDAPALRLLVANLLEPTRVGCEKRIKSTRRPAIA